MKQKSISDICHQSARIFVDCWKIKAANKHNWRLKRKLDSRFDRTNSIYERYRKNMEEYLGCSENEVSFVKLYTAVPFEVYSKQ